MFSMRRVTTSFLLNPSLLSVPATRTFAAAAGQKVPVALVKELREATGAPMMECKTALMESEGDVQAAVDWLRKKGVAAASKKAGRAAKEGLVAVAVSECGRDAVAVEINSETDFVARNDVFQSLMHRVAQSFLLPEIIAQTRPELGTDVILFDDEERLATAAALPTFDDPSVSIGDAVVDVIAKVRENVVLRRIAKITAPEGGIIIPYVHNAVAPNLGTLGCLLALSCTPGVSSDSTLATSLRPIAMHVAAASPRYAHRDLVPAEDMERERELLTQNALESGKPAAVVEKMVEGRMRKFYEEFVLSEQQCMLEDGKVGDLVSNAGGPLNQQVGISGFVRLRIGEE